jgi:hypothetical protein
MASSSAIMQMMIFFLMMMILSSTSTGPVDAFQLPVILQQKVKTTSCTTTSTTLFSQQQLNQQQQQQKEVDQRSQPPQLRRYIRPVLPTKPNPSKARVNNGQDIEEKMDPPSSPRERSATTTTTTSMFRPSVLTTRNRNTIVENPLSAPVTIATATTNTKPSSLSSIATSSAKKKEGEILTDATRRVNNTTLTIVVEENQNKKTSAQEDKDHNQEQEQHNGTSKRGGDDGDDDKKNKSAIPDDNNLLLRPKIRALQGEEEVVAAEKESQTEIGMSRIISGNSNGPVTVTDWKEKSVISEQKLQQQQQQQKKLTIKKTDPEPINKIDSLKHDVKNINESESASIQKNSKQENDKLEAIQNMIQKRKQQQIELEKIEINLLRKTMEVKKKKEELSLLQSSYNQQQKKQQQTEESIPYFSPKKYRSLSQQEKKELKEKRVAISSSQWTKEDTDDNDTIDDDDDCGENTVHPILGPVIVDLGYKRIHLVSSGRLGSMPIWKRQRTYRNDRARRMAVNKAKQMDLGFPGIICLHEDFKGNLSILDGQHRVGMLQALREERNKLLSKSEQIEKDDQNENNNVNAFSSEKLWEEQEEYFKNVLVEVYSESSSTENTNANITNAAHSGSYAEQIFSEINKAEPLTLIDIPGVASRSERKIITEAVMTLRRRYPEMFSPSQRCRTPNVNIDSLRNSIFGANVLQRQKNKLTTGKKLFDWLIIQNAALGEMYERDSTKQEHLPVNAWEKADRNAFYLGLESSWLYE